MFCTCNSVTCSKKKKKMNDCLGSHRIKRTCKQNSRRLSVSSHQITRTRDKLQQIIQFSKKRQLSNCSLSGWTAYKNILNFILFWLLMGKCDKNFFKFLNKLNIFLGARCKKKILNIPLNSILVSAYAHKSKYSYFFSLYSSDDTWCVCVPHSGNHAYVLPKVHHFCFGF